LKATQRTATSWNAPSTMHCSPRSFPTGVTCATSRRLKENGLFQVRHLLLPEQLPPIIAELPSIGLLSFGWWAGRQPLYCVLGDRSVGEGPDIGGAPADRLSRLRQVLIQLDPSRPARFPLKLRIPAWCKGAAMSINAHNVEQPVTLGSSSLSTGSGNRATAWNSTCR